MSKQQITGDKLKTILDHVHSLGVADRDQIGPAHADNLLREGLIRQVWIGNYALTEAGERARRGGQT